MSIQATTPDLGRILSASALDFVYWLLTAVDVSLNKASSVFEFQGSADDTDLNMRTLMTALEQVGIGITSDYTAFMVQCREEAPVTPQKAFRDRGALLFRGRGVAVSLGDGDRILEVRDGSHYVRYLTDIEREDGYWTVTARIPGMVYL